MADWSETFSGRDLKVFARASGRGPRLAVTFDYSSQPSPPPYTPGMALLAELGFDHVHILSPRDIWYQTPEVDAVARHVAPIRAGYERVVSYGNSMGAYGALLFSGLLDVDRVVAFAPQFTIDTAKIPEEARWAHVAKDLPFIRDDMDAMLSPRAEKYIIYDPRCADDRRQVARYLKHPNVRTVEVPFCSHIPAQFLKQAGVLNESLTSLWTDPEPRPVVARLRRGGRRRSVRYFYELAFGLARRRDMPGAIRVATKAYLMAPDSLESLEAFTTVLYHHPDYFGLIHVLLRLLAREAPEPQSGGYAKRADDLLDYLRLLERNRSPALA